MHPSSSSQTTFRLKMLRILLCSLLSGIVVNGKQGTKWGNLVVVKGCYTVTNHTIFSFREMFIVEFRIMLRDGHQGSYSGNRR